MKIVYSVLLSSFLLFFTGCSKDFIKKYDKRVVGTWRIADVNRWGIGGDRADLVFREGRITFNEDGTLSFFNTAGVMYQGSWDITKKWQRGEDVERALHITVANAATQEVLSEYYDNIQFLGTDHFRATLQTGFSTYVTHFRR